MRPVLPQKVTVTEQGKRKRKTKLAIAATQLANKGAGGDLRATKMVLDQARKSEERAQEKVVHVPVMLKPDDEIAAMVIARIAMTLAQGGSNGPAA